MRTFYINSRIICFFIAVLSFVTTAYAQHPLTSPAHVGLIYPLSSNGKNAAAYTNHFSLNIIAGVSKAETGAAIAGISNIIKDSATGVEVAGFSNHIGKTFHAATISGFMNQVKTSADGAMVTGFLNIAGSLHGFQMAGFANLVKADVQGTQVAGFMNMAANNSQIQVAGFTNLVKKDANVQVGGFLNKAENVHSQVSGFINIAKKVKGVQVAGLINIADSSEYPIGLINIVKGGERQVSLTIDETATTVATFKSGGRVLYGILGVGYNLKNNPDPLYALQAGMGAHFPLLSHFRINAEATTMVLTNFKSGYYHRQSLGIFPAYRFGSSVEVFAGPTFNVVETENGVGEDLNNHYIWTKHKDNDRFRGGYIGGTAGVQVRL